MEPSCTNIYAFEIDIPYLKGKAMHSHDFHEFFLCFDGKGSQIVESGGIPMRGGELYLLPAGVRHIGNGMEGAPPCKTGVFYAGTGLLSKKNPGDAPVAKFLESLIAAGPSRSFRLPASKRAFSQAEGIFFEMLAEMKGREAGSDAVLKALLIKFLALLMRDAVRSGDIRREKAAAAKDRMRAACLFVERNYMLEVDVGMMAEMAGLSRSHFHARFRAFAGTSFVDYLNGRRVREARRLLRESSLAVPALARACGFKSLGRFYSEFRRRCGVPPLEYARLDKGRRSDAPH